MSARLHLYTGRDEHLAVGESRVFGRAHTGGPQPQPSTVSRDQFRLECQRSGVTVTSLSAVNPTKVVLARGGTLLLSQGETRALSAGDRVLLLACDASMHVRLEAAPQPEAPAAAGTMQAAPSESDGQPDSSGPSRRAEQPPGKRPRREDGGAGDAHGGSSEAAGPGAQQPAVARGALQARPGMAVQREQAGAEVGAGQVVLVLVGVQGAGKSTFCANLIQRTAAEQGAHQPAAQQQQQQPGAGAGRRWVRVNQDTIADGRPGSREQCVAAAAAALARGDSVLIDRTNIDADQRWTWVALARRHGAQAHCLFMKLPTKVCMGRAAARTDHEGRVQGQAAYKAVGSMQRALTEAGDPQGREGFASLLVCESDAEVAAALEAWARFGPAHPDPAAEYAGLKPRPRKVNVLHNYFGKTQAAPAPSEQVAKRAGAATSGGSAEQRREPVLAEACQAVQQEEDEKQELRQQPQAAEQTGLGQSFGRQSTRTGNGGSAFEAMMAAARQLGNRAAPAGPSAPAADKVAPRKGESSRHAFLDAGAPWARSLVAIAANPESCRAAQPHLWYDERCVWLADKFPKARQHWLVVAREARLGGPLDLSAADVPQLEHMLAVARDRITALKAAEPGLQFRCGFHAVPSLLQLHMHVISQDLNSTGLKHKKHWNSFASAFFLDAEWVLAQLRSPEGRLRYSPHDKEALLKGELRCHRCGSPQANMPRLKAHIAACTAPLSQGRLY